MTQDVIIEMARQAGLDPDLWNYTDAFETFYNLAVAKEREACAKLCDEASDIALVLQSSSADDLTRVFMRNQVLTHQNDAAAIRARGQA
jgi:hypothetical protein